MAKDTLCDKLRRTFRRAGNLAVPCVCLPDRRSLCRDCNSLFPGAGYRCADCIHRLFGRGDTDNSSNNDDNNDDEYGEDDDENEDEDEIGIKECPCQILERIKSNESSRSCCSKCGARLKTAGWLCPGCVNAQWGSGPLTDEEKDVKKQRKLPRIKKKLGLA